MYNRKQSAESRLLKEIELKFKEPGKELLLGVGDWSVSKNLRGVMPTPNQSIKRLLRTKFEVVEIDEFHTSKICSICKSSNTSKFLPQFPANKKRLFRLLKEDEKIPMELNHTLLTCKMCSGQVEFQGNMKKREFRELEDNQIRIFKGFGEQQTPLYEYRRLLNRDKSASLNMLYLMEYWFAHRSRPEVFCRGRDDEDNLKQTSCDGQKSYIQL
jgi:hypothetical protein